MENLASIGQEDQLAACSRDHGGSATGRYGGYDSDTKNSAMTD